MVEKLSQVELAEIKENFRLFDVDNNGSITAEEIITLMKSLNLPLSADDVSRMISEVDKDGNGTIEFAEFAEMMVKQKASTNKADRAEVILTAFRMFDQDRNGYISAEELKTVIANLGEHLSQKEVDILIREADMNGDGRIDYKEFAEAILKQCPTP